MKQHRMQSEMLLNAHYNCLFKTKQSMKSHNESIRIRVDYAMRRRIPLMFTLLYHHHQVREAVERVWVGCDDW